MRFASLIVEGISIICKHKFYLVDHYFKRPTGEIVETSELLTEERNIYHDVIQSSNEKGNSRKSVDEEKGYDYHACRICEYTDIREVRKRLYLLRSVALEIFLVDGRNFFLAFASTKERDVIYSRLLAKSNMAPAGTESIAGVSAQQSQLQNAVFGGSPLTELTNKWINREISTFAYLMHLNTLAGRTYNDLTQYPVFPWILSDYKSEMPDLTNSSSFRDLSRPMGGQGAKRAAEFKERYEIWDDNTMPGSHYGTHYSSSMIVCSYLIRMEPFTQEYLKLQGGSFDHTDRLFHSIPTSWESASKLSTTDVRELIPEFYYLPEFLTNDNNYDFGKKQTGESIDQVILPTWANGNPRLFIKIHRESLESDYVSDHIHQWLDLIFGFKQQGVEAAAALNVFHYLSYEGAVDIDKIEDLMQKKATIGIVHNFGQTPTQLLKKPHPKRKPRDDSMRFADSLDYIVRSAHPLKEIKGEAISDINFLQGLDKVVAVGSSKVLVGPQFNRYLDWGYLDRSVRLVALDTQKSILVFEHLHIDKVTCAVFADNSILLTGGSDGLLCVWGLPVGKKSSDIEPVACMRGHIDKLACIAVSRSYSVIVTGGIDGSCLIWDLNRFQHVRTLDSPKSPVVHLTINDNTGDIMTCNSQDCYIWGVNGNLIASKTVANSASDRLLTAAFYEGRPSETYSAELILTGHKSGLIKIWRLIFSKTETGGSWELEIVKILSNDFPITCIRFHPLMRCFFSGDAYGQVYGWILPDGSGTEIHHITSDSCYHCKNRLSVLERKSYCRSCGAMCCTACIKNTVLGSKPVRLCSACSQLGFC